MGGAIKRGDRVVRAAGPWTGTVHAYLEHLLAAGLNGVPKPHGLLPDGREQLEFLPGDCPQYPMPEWVWEPELLDSTARFLRAMHDASLGFSHPGESWQLPAHEPREVICHNDFAPYNLVFEAGNLTGVIDFDTCSPGPRAWDLCYLAYRMVPLTAPENPDGVELPVEVMAQRLARLLAAYGGIGAVELLSVLPMRLRELAEFSGERGLPDHAELYLRDANWVAQNAGELVLTQR